MEEIERLANDIIADNGAGATEEAVDRMGQGDSPVAYEALRKIVLNEQNPEEMREKALNYLMLMVSRAIGGRGVPGEMREDEAGWIGDLRCGDAMRRANAALNIMIYGSPGALGPIMDAMGAERDVEARTMMIEAGKSLLVKCDCELSPSAIARARKAIDAVEAFHRRAMDLPLPGERFCGPEKDVSGNITMVKPVKR